MQGKPAIVDGYVSFLGGVDSGRKPNLVEVNQVSWGTNVQFRGGSVRVRPAMVRKELEFESEGVRTAFEAARFQGASVHLEDSGRADLVVAAGGRLYRVSVPEWKVSDVTPTGHNPFVDFDLAYFAQAERYTVMQNGVDLPVYYVGGAGKLGAGFFGDEVPTGGVMTYGNGRLWVADGTSYVAGDLVGTSSGTSGAYYRDSVVKFVENSYIAEGGSFTTPLTGGPIRAMTFLGTLDTTFGDGELIVFTENAVFATQVPFDRTVWKDLQYPVQRVVAYGGAGSHRAVVNVDNDIYYRVRGAVRSILTARRDSTQPGNVPISSEVRRVLERDNENLIQFASMALWKGWLIGTAAATRKGGKGVVHEALVVLDFDAEASLRGKMPPVWDGVWTGLDVLQVVGGKFFGKERCFLVVDREGVTEIWELEEEREEDWDGEAERKIAWNVETRAMTAERERELKKLDRFEVELSGIRGEAALSVKYRVDGMAGWVPWRSWLERAKTNFNDAEDVVGGCLVLNERNAGFRPRRGVGEPPVVEVESDPCYPSKRGYKFQFRVEGVGQAEVESIRAFFEQVTEDVYPPCPGSGVETEEVVCEEDPYPKVGDAYN